MTAVLRKNEAKLERAEEKYKSLVEKNQSMKTLNSEDIENAPE